MPFAGTHIAILLIGGSRMRSTGTALAGKLVDSDTMSSAGTSRLVAPDMDSIHGNPSFEIRSSSEIWVSIAPIPNASTGPRIILPANETRNLFCNPGDKIAWIAV